ncbi:hypothetical protein CP532_3149, partial [Ophiocordyceps camponoti-leonardi (nom. inval.)]
CIKYGASDLALTRSCAAGTATLFFHLVRIFLPRLTCYLLPIHYPPVHRLAARQFVRYCACLPSSAPFASPPPSATGTALSPATPAVPAAYYTLSQRLARILSSAQAAPKLTNNHQTAYAKTSGLLASVRSPLSPPLHFTPVNSTARQ